MVQRDTCGLLPSHPYLTIFEELVPFGDLFITLLIVIIVKTGKPFNSLHISSRNCCLADWNKWSVEIKSRSILFYYFNSLPYNLYLHYCRFNNCSKDNYVRYSSQERWFFIWNLKDERESMQKKAARKDGVNQKTSNWEDPGYQGGLRCRRERATAWTAGHEPVGKGASPVPLPVVITVAVFWLLREKRESPESVSNHINKKENLQISAQNLLTEVMFVVLLKDKHRLQDFISNFYFILFFSKFYQGKKTQTADPSWICWQYLISHCHQGRCPATRMYCRRAVSNVQYCTKLITFWNRIKERKSYIKNYTTTDEYTYLPKLF